MFGRILVNMLTPKLVQHRLKLIGFIHKTHPWVDPGMCFMYETNEFGTILDQFGGQHVDQNSSKNQDCSTHTYST